MKNGQWKMESGFKNFDLNALDIEYKKHTTIKRIMRSPRPLWEREENQLELERKLDFRVRGN